MRMDERLTSQQVLQHEGFPTGPANGVILQYLQAVDIQQMMQQAGIAQVDFGRLHQALADIAKIRGQAPQQEALFENIHIINGANSSMPTRPVRLSATWRTRAG